MFWDYAALVIVLILGCICIAQCCYALYLVYDNSVKKKEFWGGDRRIKNEIWQSVSQMEPSEAEIQEMYERFPIEKRWPNPVHARRIAVNLWRERKASAMKVKRFRDNDQLIC